MRLSRALTLALTLAAAASPAVAQQLLKTEPPSGELRQGATVLVDDGTCPKGQVKMIQAGKGVPGEPYGKRRQKSCVKRP